MNGTVTCKTLLLNGVALLAVLAGQGAAAHGGVYLEEDLCILQISYLKAHFTVFQPRTRGHEEYCEDLPDASESVFVLEYSHQALSDTPLAFRIIRDVTGKGRFARWADVEAIDDLGAATVFFEPLAKQPDVFMVTHEFDAPGGYIGIVTAVEPTTGETVHAVFPFDVGFAAGWGYWPLLAVVLVLIQLNYWRMGKTRLQTGLAGVAVALLFFAHPAVAQDSGRPAENAVPFSVTFTPAQQPIPINRIHTWILHIESLAGAPVDGATVTVDGGMPAHDHGLQTAPRVTRELGDGDYLLEGVKFHMPGTWQMNITVTTPDATATVTIELEL